MPVIPGLDREKQSTETWIAVKRTASVIRARTALPDDAILRGFGVCVSAVSGWVTAGRGDGGLVAEELKVDTEALAEAARQLRELSGQVEESALAAQPRLVQAGAAIPGSRSGGEAGRVATSVGHALGDLATALSALGVGIHAAGAHFARWDAEAAAAARGGGTGPSSSRSPDAPGVRGPR